MGFPALGLATLLDALLDAPLPHLAFPFGNSRFDYGARFLPVFNLV